MKLAGNLDFLGLGQIKNLVPEILAVEPTPEELAPFSFRLWADSSLPALKYWDGTEIHEIAKGGNLDDYLNRDGTAPMLADLILSGTDQSSSPQTAAISKGHLETELAKKENNVIGAATTIVQADLAASVAVVSDATGKVVASTITTAEVDRLAGVTSNVQEQIDSKEPLIGYTPVNKAGDTLTGAINMNGNAITDLPVAISPSSPVRKAEFDAAQAGMNWQDDVHGVQRDETLVPDLVDGNRYIIADSANLATEFGTIVGIEDGDIVEYDGVSFNVVFDYNVVDNSEGAIAHDLSSQEFVRVINGNWTKFHGLDSLVDGIGLTKTGNVLDINMGAGVTILGDDRVGLDVRSTGGLATVDPTTGDASVATDAMLAIKVEKGVETTALGLRIKAEGVTADEIATAALGNGIQGGNGVSLSVTQNTGIIVDVDGVSVDEDHLDTLYARQDGADFVGAVTVLDAVEETEAVNKRVMDVADQLVIDQVDNVALELDKTVFEYKAGLAAAVDTHVITHNIGTVHAVVTCIDEAGQVFIPQSVTYTDANTVTVVLGFAMKMSACVVGKYVAPIV